MEISRDALSIDAILSRSVILGIEKGSEDSFLCNHEVELGLCVVRQNNRKPRRESEPNHLYLY